jgi:hypothetical protein
MSQIRLRSAGVLPTIFGGAVVFSGKLRLPRLRLPHPRPSSLLLFLPKHRGTCDPKGYHRHSHSRSKPQARINERSREH